MTQSPVNNPLLETVQTQIDEQLAPLVADVDQHGLYPVDYLRALGSIGGFGVCIPPEFGGLGQSLAQQIEVTTAVGATCGSTAFMVWCQSVSAWYLKYAPNAAVRQRYLARVASAELLSGSGMSNAVKHLAGIEKIHLQAERDGDGYRVNGFLPWVSNLGEDHLLIAAAKVEDAGYIMFAVPCNRAGLALHPCPAFSGMEGTRTLNLRFHDVHIGADDVVAHPHQFADYLAGIKPGFILGQVGMGLGVVQGSIDTIRKYNRSHAHVNVFLNDQGGELQAELDALKTRTAELADQAEAGTALLLDVLRVRAQASELALRAANSALLHAGARGYLMSNPAQRRLREAIFVSIVTPALKHLRKEIHDLESRARAAAEPATAAA